MKFATLGALSRPRHHCEANQPAPSLGRGPGTRVRRRTLARPFLALRAAACTPVISARGGGGSESRLSHKRLACTRSAAPNHELWRALQPCAGRWEEVAP